MVTASHVPRWPRLLEVHRSPVMLLSSCKPLCCASVRGLALGNAHWWITSLMWGVLPRDDPLPLVSQWCEKENLMVSVVLHHLAGPSPAVRAGKGQSFSAWGTGRQIFLLLNEGFLPQPGTEDWWDKPHPFVQESCSPDCFPLVHGETKVHLRLSSVWGEERAEYWKVEVSVCETSGGRRAERLRWVSGGEGEGTREFLCNEERMKWKVARESSIRKREAESLYLFKTIERYYHR